MKLVTCVLPEVDFLHTLMQIGLIGGERIREQGTLLC